MKKLYAERMQQIGAQGMGEPGLNNFEYAFWKKISALGDSNARFVNLLHEIRAKEYSGEAMYYLHDAHLNDAGQVTVAAFTDSLLSHQ